MTSRDVDFIFCFNEAAGIPRGRHGATRSLLNFRAPLQ